MGRGPKPAKSKVEAKRPVSPKSPQHDRDLEKRLAEARERERATGEILRVISGSPTDLQPVFVAIVQSAQRLLRAHTSSVFRRLGDGIHLAAYTRIDEAADAAFASLFPMSFDDYRKRFPSAELDWVDGTVIQAPDFDRETRSPANSDLARARGFRSLLQVPMRHAGHVVGLLRVTRVEKAAFTDKQITLLQTFADQAVIAIENVRLFNELEARNRDLTATSEILQVISRSPTDVQPVFEAIVDNAHRLFRSVGTVVLRYDGDFLSPAALRVSAETREWVPRLFPMRPSPDSAVGRCVLTRAAVHLADYEAPDAPAGVRDVAKAGGWRSALAVPMFRDEQIIGAIFVSRATPGAFADREIALLQTFADQAVIAIENVRLFKELAARNHDLTTALNQQTATSEILKVISSSPTDAQPVFEAIVRSVQRLSGAYSSVLSRLVDGELQLTASSSTTPSGDVALRAIYPLRLTQAPLLAQAIDKREPLIIDDTEADPRITPLAREIARQRGARSTIQLPLIHRDSVIGVIAVGHAQPRAFTRDDIELLRTFADQAVIAIENVRLFKELEARNRDLTGSLDRQTATSEVLRVISSSPTDIQPVFDSIAQSAARLCDALDASIFRVDGDRLAFVAHHGPIAQRHGDFWLPLVRGTVGGRSVLESRTIQVADLQNEGGEFPDAVDNAQRFGFHTILSVPLLREGVAIGGIQLRRAEVQLFGEQQVALLQTFADQAVIAIENVRLFTELQEKNRALTEAHAQVTESLDQQTATSEVLKVISRSAFDLQPVLQTLVDNATRLCDARSGVIWRFDGEVFRLAAERGVLPELKDSWARYPFGLGRGSATGRTALEGRTVHIPDVLADPEYTLANAQKAGGFRTILGVPMFRDGVLVGVFGLQRYEVQPFTNRQIEVVTTFADQAAIAIENVRLFNETKEALERQTATAEILRVISSS